MSSILEALKKAELEDKGPGVSPDLKLGAHRLLATQPLSEPPKTFKISVKLWAAAGVALLICTAAVMYLSDDRPEPEPVSTAAKPDRPISSNKVSLPVSSPPPSARTAPAPAPAPMPVKPARLPEPPPAPAEQQPIPPKIESTVKRDVEPIQPPNPLPAAKPVPLPSEQIKETEPLSLAGEKEPAPIEKNIPALQDNSIQIQAISWDSTPENRIAVINNRILSENESIDDYRVAEIRKDAVLFEKQGKQFLKRFSYR